MDAQAKQRIKALKKENKALMKQGKADLAVFNKALQEANRKGEYTLRPSGNGVWRVHYNNQSQLEAMLNKAKRSADQVQKNKDTIKSLRNGSRSGRGASNAARV